MTRKIFCISMQRSGTTSVGDWLEAHGLRRAGWPMSNRNGWGRSWLDGDYEAIFASEDFRAAEILEDSPWWHPDFYRYLAHRFPDALFVLLTRDSDEWFRSMCAHSAGKNPGRTVVHAKIYRREEEAEKLRLSGADLEARNLLDITGHSDFYQTVYRRHNREVLQFFTRHPTRLFTGALSDPMTFPGLCKFAGVERNLAIAVPRSNATTIPMQGALSAYLGGVSPSASL